MDSVNVDLRENGLSGEPTQNRAGLCRGNLSETSNPRRSGERCGGRRIIQLLKCF